MKKHSPLLAQEYQKLLAEHGLQALDNSNYNVRAKALIQDYVNTPNKDLGPYGRQVLSSLFTEPNLKVIFEQELAMGLPMADGSDKVERYLQMINLVLARRQQQLDKAIYFAEFPTEQVNACVKKTPHGLLCLLNTGLLALIYHICVASWYLVYGERKQPSGDDEQVQVEQVAISFVVRIIINFLQGKPHQHVFSDDYWVDDGALLEATMLSYAIRTFVLAHEVGHIALGHTDKKTEMIKSIHGDVPIVVRAKQAEFEADLFAQDILLDIDKYGLFANPVASGGLGFFMIHMMIIRVQSKLTKRPVKQLMASRTHPTTWERIQSLDSYLTEYYGTSSKEPLTNCVVLKQMLIHIENIDIVHTDGKFVIEF